MMAIRRFRPSDVPAIDRLNDRLAAAGLPHRVGREDWAAGEPSLDAKAIIARLFVAVDGEEIRGGVWLKEQLFWSAGRPVRAGWAKYPVAESLIDKKFSGVPSSLLFALLREQPNLMALGLGGQDGVYAKLLAAARWPNFSVPFLFRLVHPSRVLRRLSYMRTTLLGRVLADTLAYTGIGWAGSTLLTRMRAKNGRGLAGQWTSSVVDRFDVWADEIWERCRDSYSFIAVRDSRALNSLYPSDMKALVRIRVQRDHRDAGWVCVRPVAAAGTWFERYFGDLKLGIVSDCLAEPLDARAVLEAGVRYLLDQEVDLIATNQAHATWCAAARDMGLMAGPSNYAFYRSPTVEKLVAQSPVRDKSYHLTRSDGNGPQEV